MRRSAEGGCQQCNFSKGQYTFPSQLKGGSLEGQQDVAHVLPLLYGRAVSGSQGFAEEA